jgi:hypothetical protein
MRSSAACACGLAIEVVMETALFRLEREADRRRSAVGG